MFSKCFILTLFHNHFINKNRSFELSLKSQQAWPRCRTQGRTKTRMSIVDSSGFGLEGTVQKGYYIHNIQQDSLRTLKGFYRHYIKCKKTKQKTIYKYIRQQDERNVQLELCGLHLQAKVGIFDVA